MPVMRPLSPITKNSSKPDVASLTQSKLLNKIAPSAIVYCEGNFGALDGKTANGLVRHSEKYKIVSVIDSQKANRDAGMVLDGTANGIPIYQDLDEALALANKLNGEQPDYFIFGMAPASGMLSLHERGLILEAMSHGLNIVNGLHEFLNDDPVFVAACAAHNVTILDVRKPPDKKNLRTYTGRILDVLCPRIAVLGTDCAIGKRTTATILTDALNDIGINAVMIGTGQTGLIQGARYGVALDAIPSQFCVGELEATIVEAYANERPDVIIVEGQGALSHPGYTSSCAILRGSCANGVILQHAPKRVHRCDFEAVAMPSPESEIRLIETFLDTRVIGLTLNHERMSNAEIDSAITRYQSQLGIPVTDPTTQPREDLANIVLDAFPKLRSVNSKVA